MPFIIKLTVNATNLVLNGTTITLPISGYTSLSVDWGIGVSQVYNTGDIITLTVSPANPVQNPATVIITGDFTKFGSSTTIANWSPSYLESIDEWGSAPIEDLSYACDGATNLVSVPATLPSTVTNVSCMFQNATAFNQNLSTWNTAAVTNMESMFLEAQAFNGDISGWNTGAVTNMANMFWGAAAFKGDISGWNTGVVTNMANMFWGATTFNGNISGWNTGAVKNMRGMFNNARTFNQNLSTWNTAAVTNMESMFSYATNFNGDISGWSTGAVTNMSYMFYNASAQYSNGLLKYNYSVWSVSLVTGSTQFLYIGGNDTTITDPYSPFSSVQPYMTLTFTGTEPVTLPITGSYTIDWGNGTLFVNDPTGTPSGPGPVKITGTVTKFGNGPQSWTGASRLTIVARWGDVSGLVNLSGAFNGAVSLISVPATLPSTVTNLSYMFYEAVIFNGNISGWNTGAVTNMSNMFAYAVAFNQNLSTWNTAAVTDMSFMFAGATDFNGDISGWNTGAVTDMAYMFAGATNFNGDISGWNTVAVTNMSSMFYNATSFNSDISGWNTGYVTNMANMFQDATTFNGNISGWNTVAVTNMSSMFYNATVFNQNLSTWNTGYVTNMANMFFSATAFNGNISGWNTGAVTDMTGMFNGATDQYSNGFLKYDYSVWSVSLVTGSTNFLFIDGNDTTTTDPKSPFYLPAMTLTFTGTDPITLPIEGNYTIDWGDGSLGVNDPSGTPVGPGPVKITGTVTRFGKGPQSWTGANGLISLTGWGDVSGLVDLSGAFYGATILTQVPTTLPSTVTNLSYMFVSATAFNQNLSAWNTGAVTNMADMFQNATAFNQNLSTWNTAAVTDMRSMFYNATAFNGDISGWNTGAVTDMAYMFAGATNFNGDISGWNTGSVTNMDGMFANASAFNRNISGWSTGAVTKMEGMFADASAFTADLSGWAYKQGPISAENYIYFFTTGTGGMTGINDPTTQSPRSPFYTGIPTPSNPYVPAAPLVVFDTPPNPTIKVGTELFGTVGSVLYRLNPSYTRIAELSTGTFVGTLYRPYIANISISNKIYGAHTGGKLFSYDTVTCTLDLSAGTYQGTPTGYMALDTNGNLYSTDSSGYIYKLTYATTSFVALNTERLTPMTGPLSIVNDTLYGVNSENLIVQMTIPGVDGTAIAMPLFTPPEPTSLIVDLSGRPYYYDVSGYGLWALGPVAKLHDFSGNPLDGTQPVGPIRMDPVKRVLYGICAAGGRGLGAGFRGAGTLFSFDLSSSAYSVLVNYVAGDVNRGETPLDFSITTETGTAYVITQSSNTNVQTRIVGPRVANGYAVGSAQLPGATTTCFNHGTKILSLINNIEAWIPVENLNIGDLVMTYRHGPRPITHIFKGVMINNPGVWHTCMYKGQREGFEPLLVTGGHGLLVDYLTEEEQAKQQKFWGRNEVVIDDKIVMIAPVSAEFTQITDRNIYTYYHFVVENDGDNDRRYGVYANGFLTETPSKNQAVVLKYKDHSVY